MCRYSQHPVRTHWACTSCRYTDKRGNFLAPACPRCEAPMVDVGRDFKAPRRADVAQWRKVAALVAAGITFDSCGCTGPGPRPRTLSDAKSQLGQRRAHRPAGKRRINHTRDLALTEATRNETGRWAGTLADRW